MKQNIFRAQDDDTLDSEREDWWLLSGQRLAEAYGEDEPEYSLEMIKEPNPTTTKADIAYTAPFTLLAVDPALASPAQTGRGDFVRERGDGS
jgi:hypothetical protein